MDAGLSGMDAAFAGIEANKKAARRLPFFASLKNSDQRPFERSLAMAASWAIAAASSACALA
jgi:hypothetical protein